MNENFTKVGRFVFSPWVKYLPEFLIDVVNESDELVAQVMKTLYIRKKQRNLIVFILRYSSLIR